MSRFGPSSLLVAILVGLPGPLLAQSLTQPLFDAPIVQSYPTERMTDGHDFDGDGTLDTVGFWWTHSDRYRVQVYHYDETDGFGSRYLLSYDGNRHDGTNIALRAGSLCGVPGFAACLQQEGLRFFSYDGVGSPSVWHSPGTMDLENLEVADLNGDGLSDLAGVRDGEVFLWLSQGLVGQAPVEQTFGTPGGYRITAADLDATGGLDLVVWDDTSFHLYVDVAGTPTFLATHPSLSRGMVTSGDVDGDGDDDLVYFEEPSSGTIPPTFQVYRRTGSSSFISEPIRNGGPGERLFDIDGDGDLDALCCGGGSGGGPSGNDDPSTFFISLNDGTGDFDEAFTLKGLGAIRLAGIDDLDGNGHLDLIGGRAVYYGHETSYDGERVDPGPVQRSDVRDADRDGDDDVFFGSGEETYFVNRGDGRLVERTIQLPAPPAGHSYLMRRTGFPADWNGDGQTDLIVELHDGGSYVGLHLMINSGGVFTDAGDTGITALKLSRPEEAALDADGDGDLDLCAVSGQNGVVWLNDGTGQFTRAPSVLPQQTGVHAADFTGDGIVDLLTQRTWHGSGGRYSLQIFQGLGDGTFSLTEQITSYLDVFGAVGDYDEDGDLDVCASRSNGSLRFFLNDGSGQFTMTDSVGNGYIPFLEDFNEDGLLDLLVSTGYGSGAYSNLYLRTGSPTELEFEPAIQQLVAPVAVCDLDGDGDLDGFDSTLGVVKSRRHEMPHSGARVQFGTGVPGTGGIVPLLGAVGPFRPGSSREFLIRNMLGRARGGLVVGTQEAMTPTRGGFLYTVPEQILRFRMDGPNGAPGMGTYSLFYPVLPPQAYGMTYILQAGARDPGAPEGVSLSNALRITFGVE